MTRPAIEFRTARGDVERRRLADIVYQSFAGFGMPRERTEIWMDLIGSDNLRVALVNDRIAAGFGVFDFGQWFGGRSLRSTGIGCVGVAPEVRGMGVGAAMMRAAIQEFYRDGYALSVLFPSTYTVYRSAGYEPAGHRVFYALDIKGVGPADRSLSMRPMQPGDRPAVRALYDDWARRNSGSVDRSPKRWEYVLECAPDPIYAYVVEDRADSRILGYVVYTQRAEPMSHYKLMVRDLAFATPAAGRRLLAFFSDHGTMASEVLFEGAPNDPLLMLARDKCHSIRWSIYWMLRIVDAERALAGRGYDPHVRGRIELEVTDDLIPANHARFELSVDDGVGRVTRGRARSDRDSAGLVRVGIRGLAPLYTGFLSAAQLRTLGLLEGSDDALAAASAIFAGPTPWMSERF